MKLKRHPEHSLLSRPHWLVEDFNKKTFTNATPCFRRFLPLLLCPLSIGWGFSAHRKIIDVAIQHVPEPLHNFLKTNRDWLVEHALDADLRKHSVIGERERHYIDLDEFRDQHSGMECMPPANWKHAVSEFGEATLREHGIGPWNVQWQFNKLIEAFRLKDKDRILRCTADLAHYVSDLHVPLHTTKNYNGALTGQLGIHALWETQIPELKMDAFNLSRPLDSPIYNPACADSIWSVVLDSHECLILVFGAERETMTEIGEENAFSFAERGRVRQKVRSEQFLLRYYLKLDGQVERRMVDSIQACAIFWYTAWVQAGQPQLPAEESEKRRFCATIEWLMN
jgi:hypothetical protein